MRRPPPLKATFDQPPSFEHVKPGRVHFAGWCFHPDGDLTDLSLTINRTTFPTRFGGPRPDVADAFPDSATAARSGFDVTLPLEAGLYRVTLNAHVSGLGPIRFIAPDLLVVGRKRPGLVRRIASKIIHRLESGRGLPSLREMPLLLRATFSDSKGPGSTQSVAADGWRLDLPARIEPYDAWLAVNQWGPRGATRLRERLDAAGALPKISVLTPVFRPPIEGFLQTAASVRQQAYSNWEWCLADDASGDPTLTAVLEGLSAEDPRIRVTIRQENGHISRASNSAATMATGEFLAFLDHDDLLSPNALGEVALHLAAHPDVDVLYSDDDKIDAEGHRFGPQFKPDWSPESLLSQMYFSHLFVVRRTLFERVGGFRPGFEGSQDHDLALRVTELARRVSHIPLVLYHWRAVPGSTAVSGESKPYSFAAGIRAVEEALSRRGIPVTAGRPDWAVAAGASLIRHSFPDEGPSVAILIPTRNQLTSLRRCLASLGQTSYRNYEAFIIDDQSDDPDTVAFLAQSGVPVVRVPGVRDGFNFARLCNYAVQQATAEYVLFLNDDTEVKNPAWISQMVGFARLPGVGAVGARLLFPDNTVQHAGVLLSQGRLVLAYRRLSKHDAGYLAGARTCRNYGAVTAACMLTSRALFLDVGGFDEDAFPVSFNDVDYCYRIADRGYRSVYAPEAELVHHEGLSRGRGSRPAEIARFRERHRSRSDPYFNPNLSTVSERFEVQPRRLVSGSSRRLNAVMFSHALDLTGAPWCQLELTLALRERGVIVPQVISGRDGPLRARYEEHGIRVRVEPQLDALGSVEDYERVVSGLVQTLQAADAEVVYANTLKTFYAIAAARRLGVPSLWNIRESEPWQVFYKDLPNGLTRAALECFVDPYRAIFVSSGSRAVFEALNARHNFCVAHDALEWRGWEDRVKGWTRETARAGLGVAPSDVVALIVGTVCERKGQHDLVNALARVRPELARRLRCFIVGDRPSGYSRQLADLVTGLDPALAARVRVIPETESVGQYYRSADVFICTSRVESFPRVTLEAMASGLPIVSTPVFGLSEQLADGINAVFYPPGDVAALAVALERIVEDPDSRAAMARQSPLVLAGLKSFDEMVDDYEGFFREAAEG